MKYLAAIAAFALSGCAILDDSSYKTHNSTIVRGERGGNGTFSSLSLGGQLSYKSFAYLKSELIQESENGLWSKTRLEREMQKLPLGGYIIVRTLGRTIDAANPKYWEIVATDTNETPIARTKGLDRTPSFTNYEKGTQWSSFMMLGLEKSPPNPFQVFIIDSLSKSRTSYLVYPNAEPQKPSL